MTERLKQLLDQEVDGLDVPAPATDAVLRQGRGLRRRNRIAVAAGAAAVAVIVGGSVVALSGGDDDRTAPDPAAPTLGNNPVFSYGNQVFYDGPDDRAEIQDNAVKSLYYTSAGVLVRHGDSTASDGGGPQRFSLVTPEGEVQRLGLETEETVHASDVDQPYVVYGEAVDGKLQVVVYDVAADAEEARVTVGPTTESWFPVSIDGDTVYVEDRSADEIFEVDWKTGTAEPSDSPSAWGVADGHVVAGADGGSAVIDVESGDVLVSSDTGAFDLSPDGRYALLTAGAELPPDSEVPMHVLDLESDSQAMILGTPYEWGWTAGGDLFQVTKNQLRTCDSATGECTTTPYAHPDIPAPAPVTETYGQQTYVEESTNELRLGGVTYES